MIDPNELLTSKEATEIKDLHDKISKSDDDKNHKLLTINTTIFAIVVTLTSFDKTNKLMFYLYLSTLALFVLSIISGYILTNTSGHLYRKALDKYLEHLFDVKTGRKQHENIVVSTSLFHLIISYFFEITTYLSLISLAAFTVLRQLI
jgi:hypothetical protein